MKLVERPHHMVARTVIRVPARKIGRRPKMLDKGTQRMLDTPKVRTLICSDQTCQADHQRERHKKILPRTARSLETLPKDTGGSSVNAMTGKADAIIEAMVLAIRA